MSSTQPPSVYKRHIFGVYVHVFASVSVHMYACEFGSGCIYVGVYAHE